MADPINSAKKFKILILLLYLFLLLIETNKAQIFNNDNVLLILRANMVNKFISSYNWSK